MRTSAPGYGLALILRFGYAALAMAGVSGCGEVVEVRNSPADSAMTVRYVELLRAELRAADLLPAFKASQCELARVWRIEMELHGNEYALGVFRGAERRAFRGVPDSVRRRRDDRLPPTISAVTDGECIALARAGVLGDTVFPPIGEFKP